MFSIQKGLPIFALIALFCSTTLAHGQGINISDTISIDYNSVSGSSDIQWVGFHAGENKFAYSINVAGGESVTFSINASSVSGDPRMQILMFNPNNTSDYWAASSDVELEEGSHNINWGPFNNSVHLQFTILVDSNDAVTLDSYVVTDSGDDLEDIDRSNGNLPAEYSNYYKPSNLVYYGSENFSFGQNLSTGEAITWKQEITTWENPTHNNEIQQYKSGYVGTDSNDNLVLTVKRTGTDTFDSSRVNTSIYNGIKIGDGEKLSVEFEAQIPVARDINGNHVENVPLWPALWLMGNDQYNNEWLGWPFCAEIDVMEWSPTKGPTWPASGYETQANVAYHWHGENKTSGYSHWSDVSYYTDTDIHTKFHKWRVDIYRYDDGTTNKIEMFLDDVYISGSLFEEDNNLLNHEYWAPTTAKNPTQEFSAGDKEYFLIMNIAMGGEYTGIAKQDYWGDNSLIPSNFEYADMVIKNVTYEISSLNTFELNLSYDPTLVSVTKTPDLSEYPRGTDVIITAIPVHGLLLQDPTLSNKTITMDEDTNINIGVQPDLDGDDDGDGVNNFYEGIIHNSNSNSTDSDNDNSSDYFEFIAGTSLTDASDYFYVQSSVDLSGAFNLEFNSKSNRNYSIKVSDNLNDWHLWRTEVGNDQILSRNFDPNTANISGLNNNSNRFFFIVDIEKQN